MVVAEARSPFGKITAHPVAHDSAAVEFDAVTLPVIEPDRLHAVETVERPGEAHGRILAAREQHEGVLRHSRLLAAPLGWPRRPAGQVSSIRPSRDRKRTRLN